MQKPKDYKEVKAVMRVYCTAKGYDVSNQVLSFWAENCFLFYAARGWDGYKYWPALAMRWVLTEWNKTIYTKPKPKESKTVLNNTIRQRILRNLGIKDE